MSSIFHCQSEYPVRRKVFYAQRRWNKSSWGRKIGKVRRGLRWASRTTTNSPGIAAPMQSVVPFQRRTHYPPLHSARTLSGGNGGRPTQNRSGTPTARSVLVRRGKKRGGGRLRIRISRLPSWTPTYRALSTLERERAPSIFPSSGFYSLVQYMSW